MQIATGENPYLAHYRGSRVRRCPTFARSLR